MRNNVFVGFGFGPIQSGLFVAEAFRSGNYSRIVIAEIDQDLVNAIRENKGCYFVNIASEDAVIQKKIEGIEIFNPTIDADRNELLVALSQATEIVTSLPSVDFYDIGVHAASSLIAQGLRQSTAAGTIVYTAENNNHAAEILQEKAGRFDNVQYVNTVIGKMSQVVQGKQEIANKKLSAIAPGIDRAFLVEAFNKILVSKYSIPGFTPGIEVFLEKEDLMPFEEAKLYGHNAIHVLLAFLGVQKGYTTMAQLRDDEKLMAIARDAFIHECGAALIKKYSHLNESLFTEAGFEQYAEDLLERMTNPYLDDAIERAARDPRRKLSENDRIFGTIKLIIKHDIEPVNMAKGAKAGIAYLLKNREENKVPENLQTSSSGITGDLLSWLWHDNASAFHKKMVNML